MRSKGSRFTLGVWGLSCVRQTLRTRSQPLVTVRNRPQPFARVFQLRVASFRVAVVALCDIPTCFMPCRSKVVLCGRRNTLETSHVILRGTRSTFDVSCHPDPLLEVVDAPFLSQLVHVQLFSEDPGLACEMRVQRHRSFTFWHPGAFQPGRHLPQVAPGWLPELCFWTFSTELWNHQLFTRPASLSRSIVPYSRLTTGATSAWTHRSLPLAIMYQRGFFDIRNIAIPTSLPATVGPCPTSPSLIMTIPAVPASTVPAVTRSPPVLGHQCLCHPAHSHCHWPPSRRPRPSPLECSLQHCLKH